MKIFICNRFVIFLLICVNSILYSYSQNKKKLKPEDYKLWKSLDNPQISNNGQWLSYEVNPFMGDGDLYLRNNESGKTEIIPRAYEAKFASCSEFIVFKIKPQEEAIKKAKLAKKKKEQLPKDSLGVIYLPTSKITKYPDVKMYMLPEKKSDWFAFTYEPADKLKENITKEDDTKKNKIKTATLVIAEPKSGKYINFEKVNDYFVTKDSKWIGYIANSGDSLNTAEVNIFSTITGKSFNVYSATGEARNIIVDGASKQLAFIFSADTTEEKVFKMFFASEKQLIAKAIVDSTNKNIIRGHVVSPHTKPYFSDDNTKLFFATAPYITPTPKDTIPEDDKISLDIWSWTDTKLMSQQLNELEKEIKKSYLAVYFPETKQINILANETIPDVQLMKNNDGSIALGSSGIPYELQTSWEALNNKDYYIIDVETGKKRKFLEKKPFTVSLSPQGRYVAYYEEKDSLWYLYNVKQSTKRLLTPPKLSVFYDYEQDNPAPPAPYGIAGWTENDMSVLIYDKYDIWEFKTDADEPPVNITKGKIEGKIINRYVKLDDDAFCVAKNEDILIKFVNEDTKEEGFYTIDNKDRDKFKILIRDNYRIYGLQKAKNSATYIYRRSSFTEFPDLWLSPKNFENTVKVSNVNPQQTAFLWGTVEQIDWNYNKKNYKGLLFKPDNFNPTNKYPLITYFYERTSQTLHTYYNVIPSRSIINFPLYTSNGYLIFIPDIYYDIGKPGESALNTVLSGVYALIDKGFVDHSKMAIHGQSWGGYQTAYIITRTNIFKAAMAGAPVSNMTSAYGAIRKESGINRIHQYEAGQSRIGATIWEKRDLYIENSPIFYADKIETPLLIMANDNDGAVPWQQGLELFLAMRRLQKPVWLLNYNNDEHNLSKKQNRIDLSIRMFQFFNYYLKGNPMPQWMKNGIPAKDKSKIMGYEYQ